MHRLALILFVSCLATAAGCGSDELPVPDNQRAVVEDIRSRGGLADVNRATPELGVTSVDLQGTDADDALVGRLSAFPELKTLGLRNTKITDAAVRDLVKFKKLTSLDVGDTKLSDKAKSALRDAFSEIELQGAEEPVESQVVPEVPE